MPLVVPTRVTLAQAIVRPAASQTRAPITKIVAHARLGRSEAHSSRPSQATARSCLLTVPSRCTCRARLALKPFCTKRSLASSGPTSWFNPLVGALKSKLGSKLI